MAVPQCHFPPETERHDGRVLQLSPTPRSTLGRHAERGRTDRAELHDVLDAGLVCHLGFVSDGAPVVLPTAYGRDDDVLYLHGSSGARYLMRDEMPACVTVTHLDGIVHARAVFSFSMNYRSAVAHGTARRVDRRRGEAAGPARDRRAPDARLVGPRPHADPARARGHLRVRARPRRGQRQGPLRARRPTTTRT